MRRLISFTLLVTFSVSTVGCGAIFNGTRQNIIATSAPDAANVVANPGGQRFTTPASLTLERKNNYTLTFTKTGYSDAQFQINKSLQGGIVILDVLFTGLIGVVVDAATGAWYKLSPETAVVQMNRTDPGIDGPAVIEISITSDRAGDVTVDAGGQVVDVQVSTRIHR